MAGEEFHQVLESVARIEAHARKTGQVALEYGQAIEDQREILALTAEGARRMGQEYIGLAESAARLIERFRDMLRQMEGGICPYCGQSLAGIDAGRVCTDLGGFKFLH